MTEESPSPARSPRPRVGLGRRLAALGYDVLLLVAAWALFTLAVVFARGGREIAPGTWWFEIGLLAIAAAFFIWFWAHGGQTLGMRAWRFKVVDREGRPIGARRAAARFAAALVAALPAGLGFWWAWVDRDGLCWHDRWSGTKLVRVPAAERAEPGGR